LSCLQIYIYIYETPDGRKLSEEEITEGVKCTLHPERDAEYQGYCEDFIDYGIYDMDVHQRQVYRELGICKGLIQETEQQISGLEEELKRE